MSNKTSLELSTSVIQGMIKTMGPRAFTVALLNASCHGKVLFEDAGFNIADDHLAEWHDTVDQLATIALSIENS